MHTSKGAVMQLGEDTQGVAWSYHREGQAEGANAASRQPASNG